MAFIQSILDAIARAKSKYNNGAYDPVTNPGGFDQDGHPINFFPALTDVATIAEAVADKAEEVGTNADTVAQNLGTSQTVLTDTQTARDRAQAWANADEDVEVEPGLFSGKHQVAKAAGQVGRAENQVALAEQEVTKAAQQVTLAQDKVELAANQVALASNQADRAESAADGVNLEPLTPDKYGKALIGRAGGPVYEDIASKLERSTRSSNFQLTKADQGKLIDITSGSFTQTFAAASTLGSGWFLYLRNSSVGDIALDPSGSETIDGLASYVMYPGEVRLVQCDGTALRSVVLQGFYRVFATSANFIKPPGYSVFEGLLWAGGASGGRGNGSSYSGGGGGGAAAHPFKISSNDISGTESVIIGAGATSVSTSATNGQPGGESSFAGAKAFSGGGGQGNSSNNNWQNGGGGGGVLSVGGTPTGGVPGAPGAPEGGFGGNQLGDAFYGGGRGGSGDDSLNPGPGYDSVYGGAGGGGAYRLTGNGQDGGESVFGGNGGRGGSSDTSAESGQAPGGAGGGSYNSPSGAGARGEMRIWGTV